jgi:hypothetical protein
MGRFFLLKISPLMSFKIFEIFYLKILNLKLLFIRDSEYKFCYMHLNFKFRNVTIEWL